MKILMCFKEWTDVWGNWKGCELDSFFIQIYVTYTIPTNMIELTAIKNPPDELQIGADGKKTILTSLCEVTFNSQLVEKSDLP